jgi:hypothetical protein
LEWLGHVIKMDQTGMVKKNFWSKPEVRRKVGKAQIEVAGRCGE